VNLPIFWSYGAPFSSSAFLPLEALKSQNMAVLANPYFATPLLLLEPFLQLEFCRFFSEMGFKKKNYIYH